MRRLSITRLVWEERAKRTSSRDPDWMTARNDHSETHSRLLKPLPGDPCELTACRGELIVYSSHVVEGSRVRYLHCSACGHLPENNKLSTPEPLRLDCEGEE